jgi:hypothetical protein
MTPTVTNAVSRIMLEIDRELRMMADAEAEAFVAELRAEIVAMELVDDPRIVDGRPVVADAVTDLDGTVDLNEIGPMDFDDLR